ncbi:MAG: RNA-directed DNA polymerase [Promethearchaeota archaeon]|nr:MAG: RNA-directed DNA polymerase [Candidatus Lokiarchaeota archaeon]
MLESQEKLDLNMHDSNRSKLKIKELPLVLNLRDLINFLEISHSLLENYFTFKSSLLIYKTFFIAKKSGGHREIFIPVPKLKSIQSKILVEILEKINISKFAHGFIKKRSIVSNAQEHLESQVIYKIDLVDFFPSIKFDKVHEVFKKIGYSEYISYLFGLLCTHLRGYNEMSQEKSSLNLNKLRFLPQGAITSPIISNLVCSKLDKDLNKIARIYGFRYTRYADDIAFSSQYRKDITNKFRKKIHSIIKKHGFSINRKKECLSYNRNFQRVTGINVQNSELSLPRKWIKNLRSALHHLENDYNQIDEECIEIMKNIEGRCAYALMVNKKKYNHYYQDFISIKNNISKRSE